MKQYVICSALGLVFAVSAKGAPWTFEIGKLTASDGTAVDNLGWSVDLTGNLALGSAPGNDDAGEDSGSAYVFDLMTGQELYKLTASDAAALDIFGFSARMSHTKAIIGAYGVGDDTGAAYVFDVIDGSQLLQLSAADGAPGDGFGWSSDISGNRAIVGAGTHDLAGANSTVLADAGAVYVFDATTGEQLQKLVPTDPAANKLFGDSVALSGSTAIVGAAEDTNAGEGSGAAYLFDITTGTQLAKLTASDAGPRDAFGFSVAISGDRAIVGALGDGTEPGAAYVFDANTGAQIAKLTGEGALPQDAFGWSVAIHNNLAVVGAVGPEDDSGRPRGPGSIYVFDATTGQQYYQLNALDYTDGDTFGYSVAVENNVIAVGARGDDAACGGTPDCNSGAVYMLRLPQLRPGDADQNLSFDQMDVVQVLQAGKYNTGEPAVWAEGDWDGGPGGYSSDPPEGDGVFDQFDIIAATTQAIYGKGDYSALAQTGQANDGQTSIVYNANTGEVAVDAPAGQELTSINIDSAAGIFTGDPAANLGGSFDNDADNNIFKATFGSSFGSLSFGNAAQTGLAEEFVMNDLTVVGSLAGGGALGDVDLIYVPEPSTMVLALLAVWSLAVICRRTMR